MMPLILLFHVDAVIWQIKQTEVEVDSNHLELIMIAITVRAGFISHGTKSATRILLRGRCLKMKKTVTSF